VCIGVKPQHAPRNWWAWSIHCGD